MSRLEKGLGSYGNHISIQLHDSNFLQVFEMALNLGSAPANFLCKKSYRNRFFVVPQDAHDCYIYTRRPFSNI